MLSHIGIALGWFWSVIIIGVPKVSVVDPSVTPDPTAVDPAPATITAPETAPRGLAAVIADVEAAVMKIQSIGLQRTVIDAAESEVRALLASLKTEYETEKAKLEAFF
ncbi:MAG: hypothetical protein V4564_07685 [Pseudomonadota bacterium]